LGTKCSDLSGGFQRLAALACALSTRPDGLLLDEPLSGIDGPHAEALVGGLADALERLRFMVVTSHFADDVAAANRVVDLTAGVAR
jgi:energy-coupling factor transporter ATP-binding protein EcfA2